MLGANVQFTHCPLLTELQVTVTSPVGAPDVDDDGPWPVCTSFPRSKSPRSARSYYSRSECSQEEPCSHSGCLPRAVGPGHALALFASKQPDNTAIIVWDLFCAVASERRRANNASRKVKALDAALRGSRFEHQAPAAILGPASFRGDGGEPHTTWREGGRAAKRIA